jgi:hypothetical protein
MIGKRVHDKAPHEMQPGEYGRWNEDGDNWHARTPNDEPANLSAHTVTEHEDGTITVSPSILVSVQLTAGGKKELYHGYLERGVWRSC